MRVGVSLLNLRLGRMGGIETYMRKLVEQLHALPGGDEVWFLVNKSNCQILPENANSYLVDWTETKTTTIRLLEAFTPWRARGLENAIDALKVDVMFYPHQAMFPKNCSVPSLLTVVDVQQLFIPGNFSYFDRQFRKRAYVPSLQRVSKIVAISEVTADSLAERCGIPRSKVEVVHLGCDEIDQTKVPDQQFIDSPYLYYPAASFPHKGHCCLFRSFGQLKRAGKLSQKLVLTGMRTTNWKQLENIIREEKLDDEIIHLGYLSYEEVLSLYKGADAILFPTEFEGFGIPVLEAVQFNKKVICSRLDVFDEIGVPKEWQIDYQNPSQLLCALQMEALTVLTKHSNTWKDTAIQTYELMKKTAQLSVC
jgi:glycosyltransferase involved in cell wall biosynthesis